MNRIAKYALALIAVIILSYSFWPDAIEAWHKVQNFDFADSDDAVRIMEVRNWLNGQGFYDLFLHRSNPPFGASMHWSRISDAPLALLQLVLRPFFGIEAAEKMAIFALPLIISAIFLLIIGKLAKRINNSNYSFLIAGILFIYSVSASYNFVAGRVDHHNLQIISLICLAYGFILGDKTGGIIAGVSIGLSLAIGFEILPLQIIMVAWLTIVWAINPQKYKACVESFALSFLAALSFGFLVNVEPKNYLIGANDALSIAQFVPISLGCILLFFGVKIPKSQNFWQRLGILSVIGVIVLGVAWLFPDLHKPLYWQISPILYDLWLSVNGEVVPMIKRPYFDQMAVGGVLMIGILAAIIRLFTLKNGQNNEYDNHYVWSLLLLSLGFAFILTFFFQTRVHSHATALAVLVFAIALPMAFSKSALNLFIVATIAILPFARHNARIAANSNAAQAGSDYQYNAIKRCQAIGDFAHLNAQPKGLVAANISLGAQTLLATNHDVVTTSYHRDWGRDYLFDIYSGNSIEAKAKIDKRNIKYFAFCIRDIELENMVKYRPNGFLANVLNGPLPEYLVELPRPQGSEIRAFKVKGAPN